ncbi:MAG: hypothetical protein WCR42_02805 [bacterium]
MGKKIIIVFIILVCSLHAKNTLFDELKLKADLQKDEQLVVIYQDIGSCIKCYLEPLAKVSNLAKEGKLKKYKIIALVRCDRAIELNVFKKQTDWKYYMYRDDGKSRKQLGANDNCKIVVLNYFGKILIKF